MSLFIDTNVVVYAFDRADPKKQRIAIEVLEGDERLVLSTQVLLETCRRFDIAIWDALIIESARAAGCKCILSEDLQPGQDFDGVRVENPFA